MIVESEKRSPGFVGEPESAPIELPGRGVWYFRKPVLEFFAVGGSLRSEASFGPEWDALVERHRDAIEADPFVMADHLVAMIAVAADMLRRNYDLDDADLGHLLRYRPGDEASLDAWRDVLDVAEGLAPKPRGDGGDSAGSS